MNAREAHQKALSIGEGKVKNQYEKIKSSIEAAANRGTFECHYYEPLIVAVELKLKEEGYQVSSYSDQRDGTTVTISW